METIKDLKVNLESKILSSKNVVIVPHNRVDFDAFASAIGISLIVEKLEKQSMILIDDPIYNLDSSVKSVIDDARKHFNIVNREKYLKMKDKKDLVVFTDVNKSNLVCINENLNEIDLENRFIIDHHDKGTQTIDTNYDFINTNASSATEIIVKLLNVFKIKYSSEVANYLLAGIYLDTNRLTKNTSPDTFKIVARLMENGASNSVIDNWFAEDFESDKRVFELVSKAIIFKYSYAIVMADENLEYTREELAKVSDQLLKYGVDAAFAIGNVDGNVISISARSKEKVNVGEIMKEFDGGGNKYSAAAKLTDDNIEKVGKRLIKLIEPHYIIK
ncbi:MAG: DHH family phosphoesterase [Bacilli bacterium]|nr:DHH family phosphoesterase [Bacilli bacterium]